MIFDIKWNKLNDTIFMIKNQKSNEFNLKNFKRDFDMKLSNSSK